MSNHPVSPASQPPERAEQTTPFRHRVTLAEVAAALGVSHTTVSNAYNRPDQLSPALRQRVLEMAERLGYAGPDPAARSLRRGQAGAIGVLYADRLSYAFADPAATHTLDGVSAVTEEADLNLLLIPGSPNARRDPARIVSAVVDGFLIHSMASNDPLVAAALERGLPAVIIDQPMATGAPFIGIDNTGGAQAAAEHLLALGHRRFGVVSLRLTPETSGGFADAARQTSAAFDLTRARLDGYRIALEAHGVLWQDTPVFECVESSPQEGRRAAHALLAGVPRPTALLAQSDQLALGILEAARALNLAVPDDLSVVGFDDIPAAAQATPPLTTVHQDLNEKGRQAGRLLLARLSGERAETTTLTLPTWLVLRGSTGRPR